MNDEKNQSPAPEAGVIRHVLVLGAGSAGLMAALALRRRAPELEVTVVRSPDLGVIGVGEGTTSAFPRFVFDLLKLKPKDFYLQVQPTWKLGLRFLWGPRPEFYYTFEQELTAQPPDLEREAGYYCDLDETLPPTGTATALMMADRAMLRQPTGGPDLQRPHAFHMENKKLVQWLEATSRTLGVTIIDGLVEEVETGPEGVAALKLDGGRTLRADFYVDCSGFRSELAGKALAEPFDSFADTLFCDRAVIGGWERGEEAIRPYTTCETMDNGWCWRIDHEHFINRGYVFSSSFVSDDAATEELLRKNPQITTTPRVVKFRSGRLRRPWVKNVLALGNAAGFVEPLEATSLQVIGTTAANFADTLHASAGRPTPSLIRLFNKHHAGLWDDIRDFLAVHYRYNTRLDTPFWQHCREKTALHGAEEIVAYYQENGPLRQAAQHALSRDNSFGVEGYYAMFVGQCVPHRRPHAASDKERQLWKKRSDSFAQQAARALTVAEALKFVRDPKLRWG